MDLQVYNLMVLPTLVLVVVSFDSGSDFVIDSDSALYYRMLLVAASELEPHLLQAGCLF
jgi:ABC-type spermidine/putrescine transport system permease subunit II